MPCRTGCPDGPNGHASWGACLRAANVKAQWLGGTGVSATDEKRWVRENDAYASAVKDGLDPQAPTFAAVNRAYEEAAR